MVYIKGKLSEATFAEYKNILQSWFNCAIPKTVFTTLLNNLLSPDLILYHNLLIEGMIYNTMSQEFQVALPKPIPPPAPENNEEKVQVTITGLSPTPHLEQEVYTSSEEDAKSNKNLSPTQKAEIKQQENKEGTGKKSKKKKKTYGQVEHIFQTIKCPPSRPTSSPSVIKIKTIQCEKEETPQAQQVPKVAQQQQMTGAKRKAVEDLQGTMSGPLSDSQTISLAKECQVSKRHKKDHTQGIINPNFLTSIGSRIHMVCQQNNLGCADNLHYFMCERLTSHFTDMLKGIREFAEANLHINPNSQMEISTELLKQYLVQSGGQKVLVPMFEELLSIM